MALIKLLAADSDDDALPPPPPILRGAEFSAADLLLELQRERQQARRREAAFLSVLAHIAIIVLLLLSPKIFGTVPVKLLSAQQQMKPDQLTYLEMPRDLITPKKKPVHPKALSDQNRYFKHPTPLTNSISSPVNRPSPRPVPGAPAAGQPAPRPAPPQPRPQPQAQPQPANPNTSASPAPKSPANNTLQLQNIPKPPPQPKLRLNLGAANQLDRAIAGAAQEQMRHGPSVQETTPLPAPPQGGNQGTAAPGSTGTGVEILTNTQGVNFDPYLRRVVDIVRRNWYAVMPETVYLGTKGRVVLIFNINSNGTVPGIHPRSLSGTASLDQAAEAAVSASNPFPPLPSEFHGPFITLQFAFYYNETPGN